MPVTHVRSPTGEDWEIRAYRVRLPPWRGIPDFDTDEFGMLGILVGIVITIVTAPTVGLLCALVEYPLAVLRGLRSDVAYVEAESYYPNDQRWLWQTTRADRPTVEAAVAEALSSGRPGQVPRAQLVEAT